MNVVLDTCVWGGAVRQLQAAGHDVIWSGAWSEDPGDEAILARAFSERRILVTLDKDFGELAIRLSTHHCGILRLVNFRAKEQGDVCLDVLRKYGDELLTGAIITAELGRIRIRSPEFLSVETPSESKPAGTSPLGDDELLSDRNWQRAVINAIEELPEDIRTSVGHSPPTTRIVIVTVSVEPINTGETEVARIEVMWWDSMRARGWPPEFNKLYGPGGALEEQADWPVIMVFGPSTHVEQGLFPGRANVASLKGEIQIAILEEMWGGGGVSMISKDSEGRFLRDDGSPIFAWQFTR